MGKVTQSRVWQYTISTQNMAVPYETHSACTFSAWYLDNDVIKGYIIYSTSRSLPKKLFKGLDPKWQVSTVSAYEQFKDQSKDIQTIGSYKFITKNIPALLTTVIKPKRSSKKNIDIDLTPVPTTMSVMYYEPVTKTFIKGGTAPIK